MEPKNYVSNGKPLSLLFSFLFVCAIVSVCFVLVCGLWYAEFSISFFFFILLNWWTNKYGEQVFSACYLSNAFHKIKEK